MLSTWPVLADKYSSPVVSVAMRHSAGSLTYTSTTQPSTSMTSSLVNSTWRVAHHTGVLYAQWELTLRDKCSSTMVLLTRQLQNCWRRLVPSPDLQYPTDCRELGATSWQRQPLTSVLSAQQCCQQSTNLTI